MTNKISMISVICILLSQAAAAFDLFTSGTYETKVPALRRYLDFAKKDGRCDFAVAVVPRSSITKIMKGIADRYPSSLRCIGDCTFSAGTFNEVKGCTGFYLSPTDGLMSSFLSRDRGGDYNIAKNKKCVDSFEELIKAPVGTFLRIPVGKFLSGENGFGSGANFEMESFLIYSANKKYTDWYFNEKRAMESMLKREYDKSKKAGTLPNYVNGEKIKSPVTDERIP